MGLTKKIMLALGGLLIFLIAVQIVVADKYKATVLVIEGEKKVGVNPTDRVIDFGDLSRDTSAERVVSLKSGNRPAYVYILKFGKIAELVKTDDASFVLGRNEEKKVSFSMYMPPSAPIGERMNGYVWIFKLPKLF